jgi:hypothetical protein
VLTQYNSVHPSNFLIPSTITLLGTIRPVREFSSGSFIYEAGAYIALPMLLILVGFARAAWHDWRARLLVNLLVVVCVASLGSALSISGHRPIPLPWALVAHLPLISNALPARFSVFSFLILGIILSLWVSEGVARRNLRAAGACAVVLFTLPNLSASFWMTQVDTPTFFSSRLYTEYLAPGDNVLIIPYGIDGHSDIWQATTGMYFRMAGGYVGQPPIPTEYLPYFPIVYDFFNLADSPYSGEMLKMFLAQMRVNAIVVADEGAHLWVKSSDPGLQFPVAAELTAAERAAIRTLFAPLGVTPVQVGGVSLYKVPLEQLDAYKNADPSNLERQIVTVQLDTLISAAARYLSAKHPSSDLNPVEAQRLGLLPPLWVSGVEVLSRHASIQNGLVLAALSNGEILVGVIGRRETVEALAEAHRANAKAVEVSPLMPIAIWAESTRWILLLQYDRARLDLAAAALASKGQGHRETPGYIHRLPACAG